MCNLVFSIGYFAASSLLIHGTENVKELAYAFFSESPEKAFIFVKATRTKRDVEEKSPGRPSAPIPRLYAVSARSSGKVFTGCFGDKCIIVQLEHLLWKRRGVGEHTDRIFINMESVCHGFHCDRTGLIRNDPVKLCKRKLLTE